MAPGRGVAPGSGLSAREITAATAATARPDSLHPVLLDRLHAGSRPRPPAASAAPAMGEEDYYLELCERPVHFEKASPVNCVFFDEANKQVRASPRPSPRAARRALPAAPMPPGVPRAGAGGPGMRPRAAAPVRSCEASERPGSAARAFSPK